MARFMRRLMSLAAALAGGASCACAHQAGPARAWSAGAGTWQPLAGAELVAAFASVLIALLAAGAGAAFLAGPIRRRGTSAPPAPGGPSRRPAWLAGALLLLMLWALPWLSLHDTHHALERGDLSCPVAQIVHSQGAGILPSSLALPQPPAGQAVALPDPLALPSRIAPEPAARSPPV
jgi:hypothetical protein